MTGRTVSEVLNMATNVRDCAWPADVAEYMVLIEPMLRELAERIKADEGAVPVAQLRLRLDRWDVVGIHGAIEKLHLPAGEYPLFVRPPAQAAQVDVIGHPRGPDEQRDEIELYLRDAYAAGCHAAQSRSMVTAMEYAHREAPKLRAIVKPTAEPAATLNPALFAAPHASSLARYFAGTTAPTAEPVAQGKADELIDAYDDAVRRQRESGFLPPLAQQAARDCVSHNRSRLRKALAAQPRAVPDGWVLVTREPTDAMCDAGDLPDTATAYDIYKAMLAAAPSPGESA